jgi:hypothetical protein
MSLDFEIILKIEITYEFAGGAGQTLNSYYKSHIVNIIDTILSWQLQCKHLVYIILY